MITKQIRKFKFNKEAKLSTEETIVKLYRRRTEIINRDSKRDQKGRMYFKPNAFMKIIKIDSDLLEYSLKLKSKGGHKMRLRTLEEILLEDFKVEDSKHLKKRIFMTPSKINV